MATYEIPITQFPGSVAPSSFEEFIQRVKDDPGVTKTVIEPELKYSDYGGAPKVNMYFSAALSGAEQTIVDGLAAATAGTEAVNVSSYLANFDAEAYVKFNEDLGATTSTSGGPTVRMNDQYDLAGGKYLVSWHATVAGTAGSSNYTPRLIVDRGGADEFISEIDGQGDSEQVFSGYTVLTLPEAQIRFELEIEHVSGAGSSEMSDSEIHYLWVGAP